MGLSSAKKNKATFKKIISTGIKPKKKQEQINEYRN